MFKPASLDARQLFHVSASSLVYQANNQDDLKRVLRETQNFSAGENLDLFAFIQYIGKVFARGSPYEDRVQVNRPPLENHLNLYFIDADPAGLTRNFENNCEYIGLMNSIIFDAKFIARQFALIDGYDRTYDIVLIDRKTGQPAPLIGEMRALVSGAVKEAFLMWVLGHEIGHAVLHKSIVLSEGPLHFDLVYSSLEKEADAFAAEHIISDNPQAATFWLGTGEFIQHEFRRQALAESAARTKQSVDDDLNFAKENRITVNYTRYHIPLLVRALRVENLLLRLAPDLDSTGYYSTVENNVSARNESPPRALAVGLGVGLSALVGGGVIWASMMKPNTQKIGRQRSFS